MTSQQHKDYLAAKKACRPRKREYSVGYNNAKDIMTHLRSNYGYHIEHSLEQFCELNSMQIGTTFDQYSNLLKPSSGSDLYLLLKQNNNKKNKKKKTKNKDKSKTTNNIQITCEQNKNKTKTKQSSVIGKRGRLSTANRKEENVVPIAKKQKTLKNATR